MDQTLEHTIPEFDTCTGEAGPADTSWLTAPGGIPDPSDLCGHISLDRHTDSVSLVELSFLEEVASGRHPHTCQVVLEHAVDPEHVLHPDTFCERSAATHGELVFTIRTERSLQLWRCSNGRTTVTVAADDLADAKVLTGRILARIERATAVGNDGGTTIEVAVWSGRGFGRTTTTNRRIQVPTWKDIRANYPESTLGPLDELHGLVEPVGEGQLVVFHGTPGTGKTTAVRSLAQAWSPWCRAHVIPDPERLFGDATYLTEVVSRPDRGNDGRRWRLLILEDGEAALATGASRLLNLTDGILGQGVPTIVLLTTNSPLSRLPESLLRPGRTLAAVQFDRFSPAEARRWLGDDHPHVPATGASLAELYQLRERGGAGVDDDTSFGNYL